MGFIVAVQDAGVKQILLTCYKENFSNLFFIHYFYFPFQYCNGGDLADYLNSKYFFYFYIKLNALLFFSSRSMLRVDKKEIVDTQNFYD